MNVTLFEQTHTEALEDRDFREWHGNIRFYGFWAILIDDPDYLNTIHQAQTQLQDFFLPGYQRQAHVTLNACGLLAETHFSKAMLEAQMEALEALQLTPFQLKLHHADSFTTAAYMSIQDENDSLTHLNQTLSKISSDSPAQHFNPHITLGLYRDHFQREDIHTALRQIVLPELPAITINRIHFCRYHTHQIQGPIEILNTLIF